MNKLLLHIEYAGRIFRQNPLPYTVIALTLALGIGGTTAIFTIVKAVFMERLPFRDPARLVNLITMDEKNPALGSLPTSYLNFEDYRRENAVFSGMSAIIPTSLMLAESDSKREVTAEIVSENYFDLIGVTARVGRFFGPSDGESSGGDPLVVVSDGFWRRSFGADTRLVGRDLVLNGTRFQVIGIAPPGFKGDNFAISPDLWVPMMMHDQLLNESFRQMFQMRRAMLCKIVARLRPNVTLGQAREQIKNISSVLESQYPTANADRTAELTPVAESLIDANRRSQYVKISWLLGSMAGLVLLIGCANTANLLLTKAADRQREMAIRMALGAGRWALFQQSLVESLLLGAVSGACGICVAYVARNILWSLRPLELEGADFNKSIDGHVLLFAIVIAMITGLIFGIAPAIQLSQPELMSRIRERGSVTSSPGRKFSLRDALIVLELGLAFVSLTTAASFFLSFRRAQKIDLGFSEDHVLVTSIDPELQGYDLTRRLQLINLLEARMVAIPGVLSATMTDAVPILGSGNSHTVFTLGEETNVRTSGILTLIASVGPHYFETTGVIILQGRRFDDQDRAETPAVAIVNEAAAKRFWPGANAIGKQFRLFGNDRHVTVVGIAKNGTYDRVGEHSKPYMYAPMAQQDASGPLYIQLRTAADPETLANSVRSAIHEVDRGLAIIDITDMSEVVRKALWAPRAGARLLLAFGGLALLLASMGVYALVANSVQQRVQEIGLRFALGATKSDVVWLIVCRVTSLAGVGVVIGLFAALLADKLTSTLLYGTSSNNAFVYLSMFLVLCGVSSIASLIPMLRAISVSPMTALRLE